MVIAGRLSVELGWIQTQEVDEFANLLAQAGLPLQPPAEMDCQQFMSLMARDKKVVDGSLRLVLLKAIGEAVVSSEASSGAIERALAGCRG
ncbi:MAG TPA: 3-dehydroquinate synthase, partial [Spongiibacteraceae bacterium]|nr:3-dehydroquinate synthase [Spongiibacteraceae bacterium]